MGKSVSELVKQFEILEKELKQYNTVYSTVGAKEASRLFVQATQQALGIFYSSYSPEHYEREFNILANSYSPYLHNNGSIRYGGVRLSPERMHPYRRQGISTAEIWNGVMHFGLHGWAAMTDAPYNFIYEAAPEIVREANEIAKAAAMSQGYQVLSKFM